MLQNAIPIGVAAWYQMLLLATGKWYISLDVTTDNIRYDHILPIPLNELMALHSDVPTSILDKGGWNLEQYRRVFQNLQGYVDNNYDGGLGWFMLSNITKNMCFIRKLKSIHLFMRKH